MDTPSGQNGIGKKKRGLRTCIACRKKAPPAGLVRFVWGAQGPVCAVPGMSRSGRGYSLCPSAACFQKAIVRRSALWDLGAKNADELMQMALKAYGSRLETLRRSGGLSMVKNMEELVARLQDALETLSCRSGDTHVR